MKVTPKGVLIGTGVVIVWVGGFYLACKIGEIEGNLIGKACAKATEKLLAL